MILSIEQRNRFFLLTQHFSTPATQHNWTAIDFGSLPPEIPATAGGVSLLGFAWDPETNYTRPWRVTIQDGSGRVYLMYQTQYEYPMLALPADIYIPSQATKVSVGLDRSGAGSEPAYMALWGFYHD